MRIAVSPVFGTVSVWNSVWRIPGGQIQDNLLKYLSLVEQRVYEVSLKHQGISLSVQTIEILESLYFHLN